MGALLLERSPDHPFSSETRVECEQIGLLLGPILETRRRDERPLPLKILGTWKKVKAGLDWLRFATEWSGPSPFPELETARRSGVGDAELKGLVDELIAKQGGKALPPQGAAVLRQLTGKGR